MHGENNRLQKRKSLELSHHAILPLMHNKLIVSGPIAALSLAATLIGSASAATLTVGPGKMYAAPCAAINAARDGDTIEIGRAHV